MRLILSATAILALGVGVATAQQATRTGPAAPELEHGKAVYAHWCAPCHANSMGLAGTNSLTIKYQGTDIPGVLEDRTDLTAPVIAYFVRNGVAWMPPFRRTEVSDADLAALSAYLTAPLEDRGAHTPLLADEMSEMEAAR